MYTEIEKYSGYLFSDEIKTGENLPIGGSLLSRKHKLWMVVDGDSFDSLFESIEKNQKDLKENKTWKAWFNSLGTGIDYDLFCHMFIFNLVMNHRYPDATKNMGERVDFYREGPKRLSDTLAENKFACAEYSVLAQLYFQRQGIPTRFVETELGRGDPNDLDVEDHSFIVFQHNGKNFVYDPSNPLKTKAGDSLPRINEIIGNNLRLKTKCLFNKTEWYYFGGENKEILQNLKPIKSNDKAPVAPTIASQLKNMQR